jgi:hypothetical protein
VSEESESTPRKLGIIVLGASRFEHYNNLSNSAFSASAEAFRKAMLSHSTALFQEPIEFLDLFDATDGPQSIFSNVREFSRAHPDLTDVVFYYCGHGHFLRDRTYMMLLRSANPDEPEYTGLLPRFMRSQLEHHLATRRLFLILDAALQVQRHRSGCRKAPSHL